MEFISSCLTPSVLQWSSSVMLFMAVVTFGACMVISAPYGRYSSSSGWGVLIPSKLGWILMESPNVWVSIVIFLLTSGQNTSLAIESLPNIILLVLFLSHYIHRSFIFPLRIKNGNPMPISIMMMAFCYCFWNGFTQSLSLIVVNRYPEEYIWDPRFILGIVVFLCGMYINISSDYYLLSLKEKGTGYHIPSGGFFELVSCANYFGEIIEWIGFAIACWSLPSVAFAAYTFSNVGPRAWKHHQWYLQKFENYPKDRKAVLPFLW